MKSKQILEIFWDTMASNDFYAVGNLLHDEYVLEWAQSGERIRGRDNFVAINSHYPTEGIWKFKINHIVAEDDLVVTDVSVSNEKVNDRVITFSTIRDGKIWKQIEFWPEPFNAPEWRKQWIEKI